MIPRDATQAEMLVKFLDELVELSSVVVGDAQCVRSYFKGSSPSGEPQLKQAPPQCFYDHCRHLMNQIRENLQETKRLIDDIK